MGAFDAEGQIVNLSWIAVPRSISGVYGATPKAVNAISSNLSEKLKQLLGDPDAVARAVLFTVTQPIDANIADIVVRPPKAMIF